MAIFRKGVKVPLHDDFIFNKDIRVGVGKGRIQGLLRKHGIIQDGKGRKEFEKDARGEIQMIRTAVGQSEGFLHPSNFKVVFNPPRGIQQPSWDATKRDGSEKPPPMGNSTPSGDWGGGNKGEVKGGSLEWITHKMNHSTDELIRNKYHEAAKVATTLWNPAKDNMQTMGVGPAGQSTEQR